MANLFTRIIFALKTAQHNKQQIHNILTNNNKLYSQCRAKNVTDINCQNLKAKNIKILVLDFDGVLAPHGQIKINNNITKWLAEALKIYPKCVYILSNNPKSKRFNWLKNKFPDLKLISNVKKKPYPDGLLAIAKDAKQSPDKLLLVDDRLLTGVLASINAGVKIIYITQPQQDIFSKFIIQEIFFIILRFIEKIFFKYVS